MFFTGLEFPKVSGSVQFHRQLDVVTVRVFVAEKKFPKITMSKFLKILTLKIERKQLKKFLKIYRPCCR